MVLSNILLALFPRTAKAYYAAAAQKRLYEAARPDDFRPLRGGTHSANAVMDGGGEKLRQYARYLEENHDIFCSVLDDLVNNIIGDGVRVAPMVRNRDGSLAEDYNRQLGELYDEWSDSPDVTGEYSAATMQRLMARSMFRDGEVFEQYVNGDSFNYRTRVPFAVELLESDFVPYDFADDRQRIVHGIERNRWGAPSAFHIYIDHPGNFSLATLRDRRKATRRVSAARVKHHKFVRRLHQSRGVSIAHAVISRLRDLKDYEESERIAARVAASMTAFIEKTSEYQTSLAGGMHSNGERPTEMSSGMIFDLLPGEKVATIKSDRPNSQLQPFRDAMLRAVAGGTGTRYSAISKDYNGTYSAQRQELVEATVNYRAHFQHIVRSGERPRWRRFVESVAFTGIAPPGPAIDLATLFRVDHYAPPLPWIDPKKEAEAWVLLKDAKLESATQLIRGRGRDPVKVEEEIEAETERGILVQEMPEQLALPGVEDADDTDDDSEDVAA